MLAIKNVVFIFTIILSFLFPSEKTLFLALITAFASLFCDFYDIKNNVTYQIRKGQIAATYLGALSFAIMLGCTVASISYSFGTEVVWKNLGPVSVIKLDLSVTGTNPIAISYWVFAGGVVLITLACMITLGLLRAKEAATRGPKAANKSFQDLIDGV